MTQSMIENVKRGLSQTTLFNEKEQEILFQLSLSLNNQSPIIREIYIALTKEIWPFKHKSMLGTSLTIKFDNVTNTYLVKRLPLEIRMTSGQFIYWLACCDRAFFPIHPIGTTVSLDQQLLPEEIRELFEGHDQDLLVTLTGRKIPVDYHNISGVIDYIGVVYPMGTFLETPAVALTNVMIKQVKHQGLVTEIENEMAKNLKEQQLIDSRLSVAYFSDEGEE